DGEQRGLRITEPDPFEAGETESFEGAVQEPEVRVVHEAPEYGDHHHREEHGGEERDTEAQGSADRMHRSGQDEYDEYFEDESRENIPGYVDEGAEEPRVRARVGVVAHADERHRTMSLPLSQGI